MNARRNVWPSREELDPSLPPLERELLLTEQEGVVYLSFLPYAPAGIYFMRSGVPNGPGVPRLYAFPPPYHVVEVMMVNRGWGGLQDGNYTLEAFSAIGDFRASTLRPAITEAARVLGWAETDVLDIYNAFTPLNLVRGERDVVTAHRIWRRLGFTGEQHDLAVAENIKALPQIGWIV